jgi:hypothetical protein|tara:strand:- start:117 stop:320 length:204 start_codon:yes stop_codon:yes gene_type:complete
MTLSEMFNSNDGASGMWASVVCKDGNIFEGIIENERPYGVYLLLGGDTDRLSMFTWTNVDRVVYRQV